MNAAEAPTAVQVWTDRVDGKILQYLISPAWFIPQACLDWLREVEFVRDVGERLDPVNLSARWLDAYHCYQNWLSYWERNKPEQLEFD